MAVSVLSEKNTDIFSLKTQRGNQHDASSSGLIGGPLDKFDKLLQKENATENTIGGFRANEGNTDSNETFNFKKVSETHKARNTLSGSTSGGLGNRKDASTRNAADKQVRTSGDRDRTDEIKLDIKSDASDITSDEILTEVEALVNSQKVIVVQDLDSEEQLTIGEETESDIENSVEEESGELSELGDVGYILQEDRQFASEESREEQLKEVSQVLERDEDVVATAIEAEDYAPVELITDGELIGKALPNMQQSTDTLKETNILELGAVVGESEVISGAELEFLLNKDTKAEGVSRNIHSTGQQNELQSGEVQLAFAGKSEIDGEVIAQPKTSTDKNTIADTIADIVAENDGQIELSIDSKQSRDVIQKGTVTRSLIEGASSRLLAEDGASTTSQRLASALDDIRHLNEGDSSETAEDAGEISAEIFMQEFEDNAGNFAGNSNKNPNQKTAALIISNGGEITTSADNKEMVVDFSERMIQKEAMPKPSEQLNLSLKHAISSGKSELKINLYPRALGAIEVTIEVSENSNTGMSTVNKIKISAENRQSLEMLEKSKADLVETLSQVKESKDASLEFDMKEREDSNQHDMHYSNEEERQKWMGKFVDINEVEVDDLADAEGSEVTSAMQQGQAETGNYSIGNLNIEV